MKSATLKTPLLPRHPNADSAASASPNVKKDKPKNSVVAIRQILALGDPKDLVTTKITECLDIRERVILSVTSKHAYRQGFSVVAANNYFFPMNCDLLALQRFNGGGIYSERQLVLTQATHLKQRIETEIKALEDNKTKGYKTHWYKIMEVHPGNWCSRDSNPPTANAVKYSMAYHKSVFPSIPTCCVSCSLSSWACAVHAGTTLNFLLAGSKAAAVLCAMALNSACTLPFCMVCCCIRLKLDGTFKQVDDVMMYLDDKENSPLGKQEIKVEVILGMLKFKLTLVEKCITKISAAIAATASENFPEKPKTMFATRDDSTEAPSANTGSSLDAKHSSDSPQPPTQEQQEHSADFSAPIQGKLSANAGIYLDAKHSSTLFPHGPPESSANLSKLSPEEQFRQDIFNFVSGTKSSDLTKIFQDVDFSSIELKVLRKKIIGAISGLRKSENLENIDRLREFDRVLSGLMINAHQKQLVLK